jgi:hypothetical protein
MIRLLLCGIKVGLKHLSLPKVIMSNKTVRHALGPAGIGGQLHRSPVLHISFIHTTEVNIIKISIFVLEKSC